MQSTASKTDLIANQIQMLFASYRRDEYADPEGFIAQLGVVLEGFDDAVIVHVTSPQTGIQRRLKWPPSIAEVVEACEEETNRRAKAARYAAIPRPTPFKLTGGADTRPGRRANVFVHAGAAQYARVRGLIDAGLVQSADWREDDQQRPGVWISYAVFIRDSLVPTGAWRPMTDGELRAMYSQKEKEIDAAKKAVKANTDSDECTVQESLSSVATEP